MLWAWLVQPHEWLAFTAFHYLHTSVRVLIVYSAIVWQPCHELTPNDRNNSDENVAYYTRRVAYFAGELARLADHERGLSQAVQKAQQDVAACLLLEPSPAVTQRLAHANSRIRRATRGLAEVRRQMREVRSNIQSMQAHLEFYRGGGVR
ncbi:hypothetical protein ANO11243_074480 [Dothideomycetidae sp. 11243]|nr:hypothetical protein ANO11243_074480 [fungal sp. No.11243]